ncbi:MAG: cytoplasmic protein [Gammaproteobacteria bacterium]|nr:MAG: cytoplasmic protein [Pseudomonadota bacterium]PIE38629.1 MAG: cytoplasmic protein [Gammaproteobacteria bacterium]
MSKIVQCEVDPDNLPELTSWQKAELKTVSKMADSEIDYSDIPPLDESFWKKAVRNPFYKPARSSTTAQVDSDIPASFKSQVKG